MFFVRGDHMKQINVGIIGFGTVGAGTFEVLTTNREIITSRVGAEVVVRKIADLDIETDRGLPGKTGCSYFDHRCHGCHFRP